MRCAGRRSANGAGDGDLLVAPDLGQAPLRDGLLVAVRPVREQVRHRAQAELRQALLQGDADAGERGQALLERRGAGEGARSRPRLRRVHAGEERGRTGRCHRRGQRGPSVGAGPDDAEPYPGPVRGRALAVALVVVAGAVAAALLVAREPEREPEREVERERPRVLHRAGGVTVVETRRRSSCGTRQGAWRVEKRCRRVGRRTVGPGLRLSRGQPLRHAAGGRPARGGAAQRPALRRPRRVRLAPRARAAGERSASARATRGR